MLYGNLLPLPSAFKTKRQPARKDGETDAEYTARMIANAAAMRRLAERNAERCDLYPPAIDEVR